LRRQFPGERAPSVDGSLSPGEFGEFGGPPMIPFDDGVGYLINPDELALTSSGWQYEVAQLAQCMSRPALESQAELSLARLISRVDTRADTWAIGRLPEEIASVFVMIGVPGNGPKDLALTLDFSSGFGFDMNVTLDSPAEAEQGRAGLQAMLDQFVNGGDPTLEQLFANISLSTSGPLLVVHGWLSVEQLAVLRDKT
jgi:hypothetical protein